MSHQPRRLSSGGRIDRDRALAFTLEGRALSGFAGDTLASALLANDIGLAGRSFKYHRPRGFVAAGLLPHSPQAVDVLRSQADVPHDGQARLGEPLHGLDNMAPAFQLYGGSAAFAGKKVAQESSSGGD